MKPSLMGAGGGYSPMKGANFNTAVARAGRFLGMSGSYPCRPGLPRGKMRRPRQSIAAIP